MFYSKMLLDRSRWNVLRDLSNCHEMHRTVMSLFPDIPGDCEDARAKHGVLFRVEEAYVLVQSKVPPNTTRLQAGYLIAGTKDLSPIYVKIVAGFELAFRIDANPSKRNYDTEKREGFTRPDEQIRWLARRGELGGFTINGNGESHLHDVRIVPGRVVGNHPDGRITIVSASFEGRLRVSNAENFRQTLEEGLGNGKSYGLGLMTVRRSG